MGVGFWGSDHVDVIRVPCLENGEREKLGNGNEMKMFSREVELWKRRLE